MPGELCGQAANGQYTTASTTISGMRTRLGNWRMQPSSTMASARITTRLAARDSSNRLHSVPSMIELPSGSASVTWMAARSGLSGRKAPICRPLKGSVTVGILLRLGNSSGANALRSCRSEPMLTVAGHERPVERPAQQAQRNGEVGVVLQRQLPALDRPAQAVGEAEHLEPREAALRLGGRAGAGEQVELLAVAVKDGVQVAALLAQQFAPEHDRVRADRQAAPLAYCMPSQV